MRPGMSLKQTGSTARHDPPRHPIRSSRTRSFRAAAAALRFFPGHPLRPPGTRPPHRLGARKRHRSPGQPRGTAPGLGRPRRGGDRGELGLPRSARAACRPVFRRAPSAPGVQRRESRGHHRRHRVRRFPEANRSPRQRREVLGGNGGDSRGKPGQFAPPARVASAPCRPGRGGCHGRDLPGCRIARPSARHPFGRACLQGRAHDRAWKGGAEGCRRAAGSRAQRYFGHDGDRERGEPPRQADLPNLAVGWIR